MKILDLFCGLGGASEGYARAGWEVVGVDIEPQPDYPFEFIEADAIEYVRSLADWAYGGVQIPFHAVHASPPCQAYTALQRGTNAGKRNHPRLYGVTRGALEDLGLPYVIENPAARPDVVLCGEMFGLGVIRHRRFELGGWKAEQPAHVPHRGKVRGWRHGVYHDGPYVAVYGSGGGKATLAEAQVAMGILWSDDRHGIVEAVPPAYTRWVGEHLLSYLRS